MTAEKAITVINNLSDNNHYQRIVDIAKNADTLYIVSPYLMEKLDEVLGELKDEEIKEIHLVTRLRNNDFNLFKIAESLKSFREECKKNDITYHIYNDENLHGKIYIASKDGIFKRGILTSANFTSAGLGIKDKGNNNEWGVLIDESEVLGALWEQVLSVSGKALSEECVSKIIAEIGKYSKPILSKIELPIIKLIETIINEETVENEKLNKVLGNFCEKHKDEIEVSQPVCKLIKEVYLQVLKDLVDEKKIPRSDPFKFSTKNMETHFPCTKDRSGSWRKGLKYCYWPDFTSIKFKIILELGPWMQDENTIKKFDLILKSFKKKEVNVTSDKSRRARNWEINIDKSIFSMDKKEIEAEIRRTIEEIIKWDCSELDKILSSTEEKKETNNEN